MNAVRGFGGGTSVVFRNRYSVFGHSGYFQDPNGKAIDYYMQEYWYRLVGGYADEFGRVNPPAGSRLCSVPEKFLNDANEHLTSERS